ncbi:MAG: amidohydrolase family protein [Planctomycetes bacterium]|nr:amidohydrolase family protein [Planctomycetota bacterium]
MSRRAAGGRLAARWIALDADHWLEGGEIVWSAEGRIVSVRRARKGTRLEDVAVMPGLVNAHVHLQLPALAQRPESFVPWIGAVLAARAASTAADERRRIGAALVALTEEGCLAVGDIDSTGTSTARLAGADMRGRCYRELTGFHLDRAGARALLRERPTLPRSRAATAGGYSPHAPYSVSAELFRAAVATRAPLAIHCAEVPLEQQFLRTGRGPFAELLARLGRLPPGFRAPGMGAVRWLERLGALTTRTQLVHCQELERGDVARIAQSGAAIVVCPGTIEYFGRTPPPVPKWLAAGIPVALGTDSRASNTGLSLRREMARALELWPGLTPVQVLAMATTNGARALCRPGLGRLRPGGHADFCTLPAQATVAATRDAVVASGAMPTAVWVAGTQRVRSARPRR